MASDSWMERTKLEIDALGRKQLKLLGLLEDKKVEYYNWYSLYPWWQETSRRKAEMNAMMDQVDEWRRREYELKEELELETQKRELEAKFDEGVRALREKWRQADLVIAKEKEQQAKLREERRKLEAELRALDTIVWDIRDLFVADPYNNGYERFAEGINRLFEEDNAEEVVMGAPSKVFDRMLEGVTPYYCVLFPEAKGWSADMFNKMPRPNPLAKAEVISFLNELCSCQLVKQANGIVEWPTGIGIMLSFLALYWCWKSDGSEVKLNSIFGNSIVAHGEFNGSLLYLHEVSGNEKIMALEALIYAWNNSEVEDYHLLTKTDNKGNVLSPVDWTTDVDEAKKGVEVLLLKLWCSIFGMRLNEDAHEVYVKKIDFSLSFRFPILRARVLPDKFKIWYVIKNYGYLQNIQWEFVKFYVEDGVENATDCSPTKFYQMSPFLLGVIMEIFAYKLKWPPDLTMGANKETSDLCVQTKVVSYMYLEYAWSRQIVDCLQQLSKWPVMIERFCQVLHAANGNNNFDFKRQWNSDKGVWLLLKWCDSWPKWCSKSRHHWPSTWEVANVEKSGNVRVLVIRTSGAAGFQGNENSLGKSASLPNVFCPKEGDGYRSTNLEVKVDFEGDGKIIWEEWRKNYYIKEAAGSGVQQNWDYMAASLNAIVLLIKMDGIGAASDEEKDIHCLMLTFHIVEIMAQLCPEVSRPFPSNAGNCFKMLGCYLPVQHKCSKVAAKVVYLKYLAHWVPKDGANSMVKYMNMEELLWIQEMGNHVVCTVKNAAGVIMRGAVFIQVTYVEWKPGIEIHGRNRDDDKALPNSVPMLNYKSQPLAEPEYLQVSLLMEDKMEAARTGVQQNWDFMVGIAWVLVFFIQLEGQCVHLENIWDATPFYFNSCKQMSRMMIVGEVEELKTRKGGDTSPVEKSAVARRTEALPSNRPAKTWSMYQVLRKPSLLILTRLENSWFLQIIYVWESENTYTYELDGKYIEETCSEKGAINSYSSKILIDYYVLVMSKHLYSSPLHLILYDHSKEIVEAELQCSTAISSMNKRLIITRHATEGATRVLKYIEVNLIKGQQFLMGQESVKPLNNLDQLSKLSKKVILQVLNQQPWLTSFPEAETGELEFNSMGGGAELKHQREVLERKWGKLEFQEISKSDALQNPMCVDRISMGVADKLVMLQFSSYEVSNVKNMVKIWLMTIWTRKRGEGELTILWKNGNWWGSGSITEGPTECLNAGKEMTPSSLRTSLFSRGRQCHDYEKVAAKQSQSDGLNDSVWVSEDDTVSYYGDRMFTGGIWLRWLNPIGDKPITWALAVEDSTEPSSSSTGGPKLLKEAGMDAGAREAEIDGCKAI